MAKLVIGTNKTVAVPAIVKVVEVAPVEPYPLLSRVKDDNDNDVGCVVGHYVDNNNNKYAVVCLNGNNRDGSGKYQTNSVSANIPWCQSCNKLYFQHNSDSMTATTNTDAILVADPSSPAAVFCRSKSFVIGGVTYYGQLPNMVEVMYILANAEYVNNNDPSSGGYSIGGSNEIWTSNQYNANYAWRIWGSGSIANVSKSSYGFVYPVLEIPIQ